MCKGKPPEIRVKKNEMSRRNAKNTPWNKCELFKIHLESTTDNNAYSDAEEQEEISSDENCHSGD